MFGLPENQFYHLVTEIVNCLPLDYKGGNLDVQTSDVIMGAIHYFAGRILFPEGCTELRRHDALDFCHELVQVAMDLRLILPSGTLDHQFSAQSGNTIYLRALRITEG
jgi:hypothetical protein